jgi:hypothetical protein
MNATRLGRFAVNLMIVGIILLASPPAWGSSTLNFPRLSFDPTTFTGVAFVNPSDEEALVTLTAYDENGQLVTGITNPAQWPVPARSQLVQLTSDSLLGRVPIRERWPGFRPPPKPTDSVGSSFFSTEP